MRADHGISPLMALTLVPGGETGRADRAERVEIGSDNLVSLAQATVRRKRAGRPNRIERSMSAIDRMLKLDKTALELRRAQPELRPCGVGVAGAVAAAGRAALLGIDRDDECPDDADDGTQEATQ